LAADLKDKRVREGASGEGRMLSQMVSALGVVVVAVFACAAYFYFSNKLLDLALPVRDGDIRAASQNLNRRGPHPAVAVRRFRR
jgi:hypothetical protein